MLLAYYYRTNIWHGYHQLKCMNPFKSSCVVSYRVAFIDFWISQNRYFSNCLLPFLPNIVGFRPIVSNLSLLLRCLHDSIHLFGDLLKGRRLLSRAIFVNLSLALQSTWSFRFIYFPIWLFLPHPIGVLCHLVCLSVYLEIFSSIFTSFVRRILLVLLFL